MDIAALSTVMSMGKVQAQVGVAIAGKVKEMAEENGRNLIELMKSTQIMEQSLNPHIGQNIDIKL